MVPNVYGMTQFADGGLMTTKPYISGSNYLLKMGDWEKTVVPQTGKTWMETWDALFWRFMHVHRDFFYPIQDQACWYLPLIKWRRRKNQPT
jgi:deoxyribodipyrimidine photolyase-related protein